MTELAEALAAARVYDLAPPLSNGIAFAPTHPGFRMCLWRRHGDIVRDDGSSSASDLVVMGTHTGTHIDAPAHISQDGRLHGDVDAAVVQTQGGFSDQGIETVPPLLGPAVLLDVAGALDVDVVSSERGIGPEELVAAVAHAGVELRPGDIVLVRTGWSRHFASDPERFLGLTEGAPGVDAEGARWLVERGARATGTDTLAYEWIAPGRGHSVLPVHTLLLVDHGIPIIEMLALDELAADRVGRFAFVLAPLPLIGATGSPVRPLALVSPG